MYSILILDDELYAVRALTETTDWKSFNIDTVYGTCYLEEAIAILTEKNVDILLTDIVMPGKTGFDMVEFIRERGLKTKIIMATAYEKFQYAQKAVSLGVVDYLLKPISPDSLKKALEKAFSQIGEEERQQQHAEEYKKSRELWNSSIPFIIERYWRDVFSGRSLCDSERMLRFFKGIDAPLGTVPGLLVMVISIDEWTDEEYEFEEEIANYGVRNLAQELIADQFGGKILEDDDENNIGILYMDEHSSVEAVERACRSFIDYCREHMRIRVSCYLSNIVAPEQVLREYRDILDIYWESSESDKDIIKSADIVRHENGALPAVRFPDVESSFDKMSKDQIIAEIEHFFAQQEHLSNDMLLMIYHWISFYAYHYCSEHGMSTDMLLDKTNPKHLISSKNKLRKWCIDVMNKVISDQNGESENEKITAVKEYIKKNYMNHISRETISNELYFNASYLSRLFKKEIGMSIFEYLASVRIEEAQKMLIYTDKKISSIALDVGYNHFSHFANIFRRITGLTPKEYRDRNRTDGKKTGEE